jgi:lipoyl-dependent peroxiredoxin
MRGTLWDMATRKGSAEWRGDLKGGEGELALGDGEITAPYTFKSRFEGEGPGSNPEELIGAAQAACYAMQLAAMLAEDGNTASSIKATADVTLRLVDDAPTITKIAITATGDVPGLSEDAFKAKAEEAKKACLISRALAAVPEMTLDASLA